MIKNTHASTAAVASESIRARVHHVCTLAAAAGAIHSPACRNLQAAGELPTSVAKPTLRRIQTFSCRWLRGCGIAQQLEPWHPILEMDKDNCFLKCNYIFGSPPTSFLTASCCHSTPQRTGSTPKIRNRNPHPVQAQPARQRPLPPPENAWPPTYLVVPFLPQS